MNRTKLQRGFTLAETLIVVAIITILSGVSFIAVQNHMRSLAQLERDGIAKEIFVAAQNHLTMSKSENYPGCSVDFLTAGDDTTADYNEKKNTCIYKIFLLISNISSMSFIYIPY